MLLWLILVSKLPLYGWPNFAKSVWLAGNVFFDCNCSTLIAKLSLLGKLVSPKTLLEAVYVTLVSLCSFILPNFCFWVNNKCTNFFELCEVLQWFEPKIELDLDSEEKLFCPTRHLRKIQKLFVFLLSVWWWCTTCRSCRPCRRRAARLSRRRWTPSQLTSCREHSESLWDKIYLKN